jgi:uncharacterized OB-fold protein
MTTRLAPSMTPDTQFFWDALRDRKLLIQRCTDCGALRHPPRPMCPACRSLGWDTVEAVGQATVSSFVVPRHPEMPFMEHPYIVALVELDEGTKLVTNLVDVDLDDATIGMRVEVTYLECDDGLVLHQFRPVDRS